MIHKLDASLRLSSLRDSNLQHSQDRENDIKKSPKTLTTSFLDLRRQKFYQKRWYLPTEIRSDMRVFRKAWIFMLGNVSIERIS
jgi:hypothetical protein